MGGWFCCEVPAEDPVMGVFLRQARPTGSFLLRNMSLENTQWTVPGMEFDVFLSWGIHFPNYEVVAI